MDRARLTRGLTLGLGSLYLAAGVAEAVHYARSDEGDLWFRSGTLLGGGALVLIGLATRPRRPHPGSALICIGSLLGILATAWTVVVPILALTVVVLTVEGTTKEQRRPVV
jgi:uncharacterized membrane protein HdeD (DUF308 family)